MFVNHDDCPLEDLGGGVRRRILAHAGGLMQVEVHFDEGAVGPLHSHPHEQISYVVSGRVRYFLGDEHADLEPRDLVTIPAGVPHSIQLLSRTVRLADAFHPVREDFLAG